MSASNMPALPIPPGSARGKSSRSSGRKGRNIVASHPPKLFENEQQYLEQWLQSYDDEQERYTSVAQYSSMKLEVAFRSSAHLGLPNAFRTAICCDLLEKVCGTFGRYQSLVRILLPQLYRSVYKDYDTRLRTQAAAQGRFTARIFFEGDTRFMTVKAHLQKRQALQGQLRKWEQEIQSQDKQMRNREFMLKKVGKNFSDTILVQTFRAWAKVVTENKRKRENLGKAFRHFTAKFHKAILHSWKLLVENNKRDKLNQDLAALKNQTAGGLELLKEVEDESTLLEEQLAKVKGELDRKGYDLKRVLREKESVDRDIANSKEKELQDLAVQWQRLTYEITAIEVEKLSNSLQSMSNNEFHDPTLLLKEGEEHELLLTMPVDLLVLRWVQFQMKKVEKGYRYVQNFGSDLRDSEVYSTILQLITADTDNPQDDELESADPFARAEEIIDKFCHYIKPRSPKILEAADITDCVGDKNMTQMCFLMANFPSLTHSPSFWKQAEGIVNKADVEWKLLFRKGSQGIGSSVTLDGSVLAPPPASKKGKEKFLGVTTQALTGGRELVRIAKETVESTVAQRWTRVKLWERVRARVQNAAWQLLIARGHGAPVVIVDRKEIREREMYTKIDHAKMKEVLAVGGGDPEAEAVAVEKELTSKFDDLRRIFKHYAAAEDGGGNNSMNMNEYVDFVKDTRLISKEDGISMSDVQTIFAECNDEGYGAGNSLNPDFELTANEFVEGVVRLAECKYRNEGNMRVSERLRNVLSQKIIKFACRSDVDRWRKAIAHPNVKEVFFIYRKELEALFTEYAGEDGSKLMSAQEFRNILSDKRLFDDAFTKNDLYDIFSKIQQDDDAMISVEAGVDTAGGDAEARQDEMELTYSEFLEGLAAITVMRDPDPYTPMAGKLEKLVRSDLLRLKKGKKKKEKSS